MMGPATEASQVLATRRHRGRRRVTGRNETEVILWEEFVRAVAAKGLQGSSLGFPPEPLDRSNWTLLVQGVRFHRLAGLWAAAVHDGDLPTTEGQREEVLSTHATAMRLCLELEDDLLRVGALFDKRGVPYRVLKGPAFAHLDYADPALRAFADIDLLVRSEDFDTAVDTLIEAGSKRKFAEIRTGFDRRFGKGATFTGPTGHELDLHRTFAMGPFGLTVQLDDVWASVDRFEIAGRWFETLDPDQRFLHACYHAAIGKARPRLSPLRDLVGMLQRSERRIDIERVLDLSARWRSSAVVARAVNLAWDAFALPEDPMARWANEFSPSRLDQRALRTYLDLNMGFAARSYAALRVVRGVRSKVAFAWALAFPEPAYGAGQHHSHWARWRNAAREIAALGWRTFRR